MISVVNGHVEVMFELGSGEVTIQTLDGPQVNDGNMHTVVFTRTGSEGQV